MTSHRLTFPIFGLYRGFVRGVCHMARIHQKMLVRKTIRVLGVSLALVQHIWFSPQVS